MARRRNSPSSPSSFSLADLQRLLADRQAAVAELAVRRNEIIDALAKIDAEISGLTGTGNATRRRKSGKRGPGRPPKAKVNARRHSQVNARPARKPVRGAGRPAGPKGRSILHDAIRAAMTGAQPPMKAVEIAKKVVDNGYQTKSKVFHLIIGQRLAEMADVVKPERGLYSLRV